MLFGLVGVAIWRRDRRGLALVVPPVVVAGAWYLWLRVQLGSGGEGIMEFGVPFVGLGSSISLWVTGSDPYAAIAVLAAIGVAVAALVRSGGLRHPLGWAVALQLGFMLLLTRDVIGLTRNGTRMSLDVLTLGLIMLVTPRARASTQPRRRDSADPATSSWAPTRRVEGSGQTDRTDLTSETGADCERLFVSGGAEIPIVRTGVRLVRFSARRVMTTALAVLTVVGHGRRPDGTRRGRRDLRQEGRGGPDRRPARPALVAASTSSASSTTPPSRSSRRSTARSTRRSGRWRRPTPSCGQARRQLASYAVEAFVNGGDSALPDILLTGKGPDVVSQVEYLKSASSNRSQLIDDVRAAEYSMKTHLAELKTAKASAKALQTKLNDQKAAADRAMTQQQKLQATVTGQLAYARAPGAGPGGRAGRAAGPGRGCGRGPADRDGVAGDGRAHRRRARRPPCPGTAARPRPRHPARPPTTGDRSTRSPIVPLPIPPGTPPPVLPARPRPSRSPASTSAPATSGAATTPRPGFDCSGLVQYSFGQAGVSLPRVADEQAAATWHVSYANAQPGDLVFFDSPDVGHVGIYLGGGMMLDAPAHRGGRPHRRDLVVQVGRVRPRRLTHPPHGEPQCPRPRPTPAAPIDLPWACSWS